MIRLYLRSRSKRKTSLRESSSGGIAQLARALAWHARGPRFDSEYLHQKNRRTQVRRFAYWLHSLMDRIGVSGTLGPGSIPGGATLALFTPPALTELLASQSFLQGSPIW